ncbi:hypothetical protein LSAT2_009915 [Lamellibrachia satsuma]|nr:hypothetical protein LSAT2_009915 [Lamellibrachia satsuma]
MQRTRSRSRHDERSWQRRNNGSTFSREGKRDVHSVEQANTEPRDQMTSQFEQFNFATMSRLPNATSAKDTRDEVFATLDIRLPNKSRGHTADLNVKVDTEPPKTPTHFAVLKNSTSVALTLQWQPGLSGSHPPQVFTIQYMADTKPNLFHGRSITTDESKQQQVTLAGLEPETLYKFTLYARNNNTDVIRSGVTTVSGWTTASPEVTLEAVEVQADHITVSWSTTRQSSRRKRSMSTVVSVVIHYQLDGGKEDRYPPEGSVDVKQQSAVVSGQFDTEATYKVWLKVYEGQLTFPSKILQPMEATATTENKECSCSTSTVIAGVVGSLLLVLVFTLLVFGLILRRRQQSNNKEGVARARDDTKRQTPIEMSDDIRSSAHVIDDTKQYQTLRDRAAEDTSNLRGTYASLDEPEATQQHVPGTAYENVDTISQPKSQVSSSYTPNSPILS